MTVPSYNDIFHVGHKAIEGMWESSVEIQEKIDGSQISFWINPVGGLEIRSKGQQIIPGSPSAKMFDQAVESINKRQALLTPGQIWRGEYLTKPKHNTLCYSRIPFEHIIIFDIQLSLGEFATPEQRQEMSANLGYEVTPTLFQGNWEDPLSELNKFLETDSVLGGQKIEGIVAKCYTKFLPDGKPMMGKLVSQAFKEKHSTEWKKSNPGTKDVIQNIIDMYKVEARWRKAIQHLREQGLLVDGPQDIGPLLKEVAADVYKEEADAIKELLFKNAWPQISRGIGGGLPDWYKNVYLLEDK